jgi:hypoxanthine-guanine phosphoribosyltransferase
MQFDVRSTDDKHVMAIDLALNSGKTTDDISRLLKDAGASEVNLKSFN